MRSDAARRRADPGLRLQPGQGGGVRSGERKARSHEPAAPTDVLIVGSGIGGATLAAGLAESGAAVTILERGEQLPDVARRPRHPRHLPEAGLPAERDLARRRRRALQSGQLLLCRRQFQILRRGVDPLPARGFRGARTCRRCLAGLADLLRRTRALVRQGRGAVQVRGRHGEDPTEPPAPPRIPSAGSRRARHRRGARRGSGRSG